MRLFFAASLLLLFVCAAIPRTWAGSGAIDTTLEARAYTPPDDCSGCDWQSIDSYGLEWCYCCKLCSQYTQQCIDDNGFCMLQSRCAGLQLCQDPAIQELLPASTTAAAATTTTEAATTTTSTTTEAATTTTAAENECPEPDSTCTNWGGFCAPLQTMCPQGAELVPQVPCNAAQGGFNCVCCHNISPDPTTTSTAAAAVTETTEATTTTAAATTTTAAATTTTTEQAMTTTTAAAATTAAPETTSTAAAATTTTEEATTTTVTAEAARDLSDDIEAAHGKSGGHGGHHHGADDDDDSEEHHHGHDHHHHVGLTPAGAILIAVLVILCIVVLFCVLFLFRGVADESETELERSEQVGDTPQDVEGGGGGGGTQESEELVRGSGVGGNETQALIAMSMTTKRRNLFLSQMRKKQSAASCKQHDE